MESASQLLEELAKSVAAILDEELVKQKKACKVVGYNDFDFTDTGEFTGVAVCDNRTSYRFKITDRNIKLEELA